MIELMFRSLRGGSWDSSPRRLPAAIRDLYRGVNRYSRIGFRLVVRIKDE